MGRLNTKAKRAVGVLVALAAGLVGYTQSDQNQTGSHGGRIQKQGNTEYEIVSRPESDQVEVYATGGDEFPPRLVLQLKKDDEVFDRIYLNLTERTPQQAYYNGIVQSNVLVSGGVTFELE